MHKKVYPNNKDFHWLFRCNIVTLKKSKLFSWNCINKTWNNLAASFRPSSLPIFWVSAIWLCIAAMLNSRQTRSNELEAIAVSNQPQTSTRLAETSKWKLLTNTGQSVLTYLSIMSVRNTTLVNHILQQNEVKLFNILRCNYHHLFTEWQ